MLDLLAAGAAALGFALTPAQLAQFETYAALLVEWNVRVNLTAITDPARIQTHHFVDSLAVGAALLAAPNPPTPFPRREGGDPTPLPFRGGVGGEETPLIDLGTGAGFPGLPLKILWPELPLTLVDSVGKKTAFLEAVVAALGLRGVTVLTGRAEALGQDKAH